MKRLHFIIPLIAAILVISCGKDDPFCKLPEDPEEPELSYLVTPLESSDGLKQYKIEYDTPGYDGKTVRASMLLAVPKKPNCIVSDAHYTVFSDKEVPSNTTPTLVSSSYSLLKAVWISADYIGYGTSKDHTHPYSRTYLNAKAQLNAMKVGLCYMRDSLGIDYGRIPLYLCGHSQGGAVALATQRYLEEDKEMLKAVNFRGSYISSGPYDMSRMMDMWVDDEVKIAYPCAIPLVIDSVMETFPDKFKGIDISDCLSKDFIDSGAVEAVRSKELEGGEINSVIFRHFNEIRGTREEHLTASEAFSPRVLAKDTVYEKIRDCLEKDNLCKGWTPSHHIELYHSHDDEIVPWEMTVELIDYFESIGFDDFKLNGMMGDHTLSGTMFYLALGSKLISNSLGSSSSGSSSSF